MTTSPGPTWADKVRNTLRFLDQIKEKDRLDRNATMWFIIGAMSSSIRGWAKWLSSPTLMAAVSEEDFEDAVTRMRKIAKEWLDLDIEITEKYGPRPIGPSVPRDIPTDMIS